MITFAEDKHIPALKELFKSAFGDSDSSVDFYFSNIHKNENVLVYMHEDEAVAILSMLPIKMLYEGREYSARYVFAVATHEAYRSRGISSRLLEYAHEYMKKNGTHFSVLVPASQSLFDFYEKRGDEKGFLIEKTSVCGKDIKKFEGECDISVCSAEEYYKIRKMAFEGREPFAMWEIDMLSKIVDYMRFCGGEFYKLQMDCGVGAAYAIKNKDEIIIKELALCGINKRNALEALHEVLGAERYEVIGAYDGKNIADFAMICNLCGEEIVMEGAYFNLAMD